MLEIKYEEMTGGAGGQWQNAPAGIHKAICCDLVDLGEQETQFGTKHQCEFVFELDKDTAGLVESTGNAFTVRTQRFNLPELGKTLNEKASLFKFLCSWRGKPIESGENIPLEKLVGVNATLVLTTKTSKTTGNEYTAIDTLTPKRKGEAFPQLSGAYIRRKDREGFEPVPAPAPVKPAASQPTAPAPADNLDDDDVPF